MKILNISLHNFRRFNEVKFKFHPRFTVLIGDNGAGKTTVLDALSILLGTYFQGARIKTGQGAIKKDDARFISTVKGNETFCEPQKEVFLSANAIIHNERVEWTRDIGDRGGRAKNLVNIGSSDREKISRGESPDLPILLYYGSGRLWDVHRDIDTENPGSQLDAYRFCLDPKSDQKAFEKWFKKRTYAKLQKNQELPSLDVVKNAVLACIPEAKKFYHDIDKNQIMISLENEGIIPFNCLSDGYRNMVSMVADIAYRASQLNPHLEGDAARRTSGVVLIDEIDLHLHPKWQREVVGDLQKAFPQIQFIATTHSPFIIQSLEAGQIIDLSRISGLELVDFSPDGIAAPGPGNAFSDRSIEDIVEDVMGVDLPQRSIRYQKMYDAAKEYYRVIEDAKNSNKEKKEELKRKLDELSAPFSDNVAYHAFLEMKRLAAGLGNPENEEK
ncbi:MAG: AAA family ATPase [Lentisphaerota bacterium]